MLTVPDDPTLDACAAALETVGFAALPVGEGLRGTHARCFAAACAGLDQARSAGPDHVLAISAEADSASASGLHRAGALSQYNVCREGLIFSNGAIFDLPPPADGEPAADHVQFAEEMAAFFASAMALISGVFAALERRLQLPVGWFEHSLGPVAQHSQWHVKRYVPEAAPSNAVTTDGKHVLLPVHSDPSLLSLIVHDRDGTNSGALGLECNVKGAAGGEWVEVAAHGHSVVTVLCGAVLERITGGRFVAARHRVAVRDPNALGRRVAATFFFRPAPSAVRFNRSPPLNHPPLSAHPPSFSPRPPSSVGTAALILPALSSPGLSCVAWL